MKKIVFFILAAALPLLGCAGGDCAEMGGEKGGEKGGGLAVTFATAAPTRAFFDGEPEGEPWEREIRTLEAILCNGTDNVLHRRQLTRAEIESGKAIFSGAELPTGDCKVYLLANYDISGIAGGFDKLTDTPVSKYNGSYEQLRQGCATAGGFTMSAAGTLTPTHTYQNPLHLTLTRTVSKLELKIVVGDELSARSPNGELVVTETIIDRIALNAPLFDGSETGETTLSQTPFEQQAYREYRNVFYLFAHETLVPEITLHARFYPDGKATNPSNFTEHTFTFSPEGVIAPNTYYRLQAQIENLDGIVVPTSYTVTYHPNGGIGSTYSVSAEAGDYYVLHPGNFDRYPPDSDYYFYEWNTRANGTGSPVAAQNWIQLSGNLDLYAIWRPGFRITAAPAFTDDYLQYGKWYEVVYTVTPWPDVTGTFSRFDTSWGRTTGSGFDGNYLDINFPSVSQKVYPAEISASGTFSLWFRYSAPLFTRVNSKPSFTLVFMSYFNYDNRYDRDEAYTYQWMPKAMNQLEIVTRWQGESLGCTTTYSTAYTSYQTGEGPDDWTVYFCDEDGFTLDAVPDAGYRFEGWYLDGGFTQLYSDLPHLDYVPSQSVLRLFPKTVKIE